MKSGSHRLFLPVRNALRACDLSTSNNANIYLLSASSLIYRPASSTTSNLNLSNGHLSSPAELFPNSELSTSESESDLSEAVDVPNVSTLSPNADAPEVDVNSESHRINTESSHDEDAIGSDDEDCTMEEPAPPSIKTTHDDPSSSEDSRRNAKRKVGVDQDDYMMNNPELYGLRRSVKKISIPT